jgi:hypothetical protein
MKPGFSKIMVSFPCSADRRRFACLANFNAFMHHAEQIEPCGLRSDDRLHHGFGSWLMSIHVTSKLGKFFLRSLSFDARFALLQFSADFVHIHA